MSLTERLVIFETSSTWGLDTDDDWGDVREKENISEEQSKSSHISPMLFKTGSSESPGYQSTSLVKNRRFASLN